MSAPALRAIRGSSGLGAQNDAIATELRAAFDRVLHQGQFIGGPEVAAFEEAFAATAGTRECVAVGNGTDALRLLLQAHNVGPSNIVLVPAHTFVATWQAVSAVGALPVPVDAHPDHLGMDPQAVQATLAWLQYHHRPVAAAIVAHMHGVPAPVEAIRRILPKHVLLFEDAAQAHGAEHQRQPVGSLADGAAWSFYPTKNLGALGDAGAITTNNPSIAKRVRQLRHYGDANQGMMPSIRTGALGSNSRMDALQAAILRAKLPHLERWNQERREQAAFYAKHIDPDAARMMAPRSGDVPVWHHFPIAVKQRDQLQSKLAATGITTQIHYPVPPRMQPFYRRQRLIRSAPPTPVADWIARHTLSLPLMPERTDEHPPECIHQVVELVNRTAQAAAAPAEVTHSTNASHFW